MTKSRVYLFYFHLLSLLKYDIIKMSNKPSKNENIQVFGDPYSHYFYCFLKLIFQGRLEKRLLVYHGNLTK